MRSKPTKRNPCNLALLGVAIWFLGFELAPMVHLTFHGLLGEHHHGVASHHAHGDRPDGDAHETDDVSWGDEAPSEHGEGSLAHRDLAAHGSPLTLLRVKQPLLAWSEAAFRPSDDEARQSGKRLHPARGPPA